MTGAGGRALALAVVGALALLTAPASAQVPAEPVDGARDVRLELVSQTPWVGPNGDFEARVQVRPPESAAGLEVVADVFPPVATRSEFALTLDQPPAREPLLRSEPARPDATGAATVRVALADPASPARAQLGGRDGVHPVAVRLRASGGPLTVARLLTHLVYLPGERTGPALAVSLVLPMHAPPAPVSGGGPAQADVDRLGALAEVLGRMEGLPLSLAPTPATLDELVAEPAGPTAGVVAALRRAAAGRTVLAGTYVPVSLPSLLEDLQGEAVNQRRSGRVAVEQVLRARADASVLRTEGPLDAVAVDWMAREGVTDVVVDEPALVPVRGQVVTLTRPFRLRGSSGELDAVAADTALAAHLTASGPSTPALRAQRVLADLTVLYLDMPGDRRGVVVSPPRSWSDPEVLAALAGGLTGHPVLEAVDLERLFETVETARAPGGQVLVRRPLVSGTRDDRGLASLASDIAAARRRVDSLAGVLGPENPVVDRLQELVLVSESADIASARERSARLSAIRDAVDQTMARIRVPAVRSITLTARRGTIPVTFLNESGFPARLRVNLTSQKLDFPGGRSRVLDLTLLNTTKQFPVVARTSGTFPMDVELTSPDGALVVGHAQLTVRSTAAPGLGLAVSAGAALFLAVWWGRHAHRGRRARRLVPS